MRALESVNPKARYDQPTVEARQRLEAAFAEYRDRGGAATGLGGFFKRSHYHRLVVLQRRRIHHGYATTRDDQICSCGLLVPHGMELLSAHGHRDSRSRGEISALITYESLRPAETSGGPARYRLICQSCGSEQNELPLATAHRLSAEHGVTCLDITTNSHSRQAPMTPDH